MSFHDRHIIRTLLGETLSCMRLVVSLNVPYLCTLVNVNWSVDITYVDLGLISAG